MEDRDIVQALREGFPLPDEAKRDDLLHRCLAEIDCSDGVELDDDVLDALAAAGDVFLTMRTDGEGGGLLS